MEIDKSERSFWKRRKFKTVEQKLRQEFGQQMYSTGMCHLVWARKKHLLKQMYNINWQSPAELNPHIIFE